MQLSSAQKRLAAMQQTASSMPSNPGLPACLELSTESAWPSYGNRPAVRLATLGWLRAPYLTGCDILGHLVCLLLHLCDVTHHVEGHLRQVIVLALQQISDATVM